MRGILRLGLGSIALLVSLGGFGLAAAAFPHRLPPAAEAASVLTRDTPADSTARLKVLRDRVRSDRLDATSRRALASLLGPSDDIELRREAFRALEEALLITNDDPEIWIEMARLQDRRGFLREARVAYHQALDRAPDRADIWGELAQHELRRFQRYQRKDFLSKAEEANLSALRYDGTDTEEVRRGLRIALYRGRPVEVDSLCVRWNGLEPESPWPWLVRGALFVEAKAWSRAQDAFNQGLDRMTAPERVPFETLALIHPDVEEERLLAPDTLRYVADFWRWQDPTPADDLNPRLLEQYRRMVMAELLFGIDEMNLPGWNHAPGRMLVRYGMPEGWSYDDDVVRLEEYNVSSGLWAPTIGVNYGERSEPLTLIFVDYNLNGRFYSPIEGTPRYEDFLLAATTTYYDPPFSAPDRDQEIELWRFVPGENDGRIEVAIALTADAWPEPILNQPEDLSTKLTLYDETWNVRDAAVGSWAHFERDDLGRLVGLFTLDGTADSVVVGLETAARSEQGRAAGFAKLPPRDEPGPLQLSDLAFLSAVSFDGAGGRYRRGLGSGLPNPGHRYPQGAPLGIAFEVYGLEFDAEGYHRGRIRISVGRPTRAGWFKVLLRMGRRSPEAELVFDSEEQGGIMDQLLSVEVPALDTGDYELRVEVEDRISGHSVTRRSRFTVLEPDARR